MATRPCETRASRVMCLIARGRPLDPIAKLLPGYELIAARSLSSVRTFLHSDPCELYIVQTPLGWAEAAAVCRTIRITDPHTPIVVYTMQRIASERREVIAAGAQAYVADSHDPHNLQGRVGQLVMLAELRSMEAMASQIHAMRERIAAGLQRVQRESRIEQRRLSSGAVALLKRDAARIFVEAGGTRANFERFWPAIYAPSTTHPRRADATAKR